MRVDGLWTAWIDRTLDPPKAGSSGVAGNRPYHAGVNPGNLDAGGLERARGREWWRRGRWAALLIVAVCSAVYWVGLGANGLSMSEGHRAIPGWEMARSGEWLVPRMYERVYVRKPPGMFWAIAASAKVLGETEFSARAVSAMAMTVSALVVFLVTRRWFGGAGGLAAGLAQALTPLWWSVGRSAEIEALNNALTQAACLLAVDAMMLRREGGHGSATDGASASGAVARSKMVTLLGIALCTGGALLAKGPACASAIGAVLVAGLVVGRPVSAVFRPSLVAGLVLGVAAFGAWVFMAERAIAAMTIDPVAPVVRQSVGDFLYGPGWPAKLAFFPFATLASVMPAGVAMLFVFGREARAERDAGREACIAHDAARVLTLGALLGVGALMLSGVTNPRYAMPVLTLVPPTLGYVVRGALGGFGERRQRIARGLMLGGPARLGLVVLIAAVVTAQVMERSRERNSGRDAGERLGVALAERATARGEPTVEGWADHSIEARPEVLEWCRRKATELGVGVRARWVSLASVTPAQAAGVWLLVRADEGGDEAPVWRAGRESVGEARAAKFGFVVLAPGGAIGPVESPE